MLLTNLQTDACPPDHLETLFFSGQYQHHCRQVQLSFLIISGLMGNVNIDSVIPYILNMNTAASSEHLDDSDDDIVDHEADDDQD